MYYNKKINYKSFITVTLALPPIVKLVPAVQVESLALACITRLEFVIENAFVPIEVNGA